MYTYTLSEVEVAEPAQPKFMEQVLEVVAVHSAAVSFRFDLIFEL